MTSTSPRQALDALPDQNVSTGPLGNTVPHRIGGTHTYNMLRRHASHVSARLCHMLVGLHPLKAHFSSPCRACAYQPFVLYPDIRESELAREPYKQSCGITQTWTQARRGDGFADSKSGPARRAGIESSKESRGGLVG